VWIINWGRLAGVLVALALILALFAVLKFGAIYFTAELRYGNWWIAPLAVCAALAFAFVFGSREDRQDFYKLWNWLTFRGWRL